jgi:addiction module RelE/StbE family toxin
MRIDWSPHALLDLKSISEYIEQDRSSETANSVTRAMPNRGRRGRIEGTRELVVSNLPYVVVYRAFDERVLILNIVHGAQRWP